MTDTGYSLNAEEIARTAPARPGTRKGRPEDRISKMNTTRRHRPAHAGLFSTASDVGRFAQMMPRRDTSASGERVFAETTWSIARSDFGWCAGWVDHSDNRSVISKEGYTGTYVHVDFTQGWALVYLTNRTHLNNDENVYATRFAELAHIVRENAGRAQTLALP